MKLGFASAIVPDLSYREMMEFASQEGFECIEVMCWPKGKAERRYAGITHIDVNAFDDALKKEVLDTAADAGIEISALGYYPNPLTPDKEEAQVYIDHLKNVITASADLGVGRINTFIGRDWKKSVDENWPRFLEVWEPLVRFAEDKKVQIGIENCPMAFTNDEWPGGKNLAGTPAVWRRMFKDIPSDYFGLNYDPSHLVWQQIDYIKPLMEFIDKIFHVHAKDVRVDKERLDDVGIMATPLEYHNPKLPGLGEINWGRFFSVLGDLGYTGPVCIEVEDRAYEESLETRKAALTQSRRFLKNFI